LAIVADTYRFGAEHLALNRQRDVADRRYGVDAINGRSLSGARRSKVVSVEDVRRPPVRRSQRQLLSNASTAATNAAAA
jgi:hypothetical protein